VYVGTFGAICGFSVPHAHAGCIVVVLTNAAFKSRVVTEYPAVVSTVQSGEESLATLPKSDRRGIAIQHSTTVHARARRRGFVSAQAVILCPKRLWYARRI